MNIEMVAITQMHSNSIITPQMDKPTVNCLYFVQPDTLVRLSRYKVIGVFQIVVVAVALSVIVLDDSIVLSMGLLGNTAVCEGAAVFVSARVQ